MSPSGGQVKRRWGFYSTPAGRRPVAEFIDGLSDSDAAEVHAAMRDVRDAGLRAARHLREEIYEVRAEGANDSYRILFATDGKKSRIHELLGRVGPNLQQFHRDACRLIDGTVVLEPASNTVGESRQDIVQ